MDNHFDRRERTIYVWMLERKVTDDQLYALFSKIGPIEKLIFKEFPDGTPQHCLIVFRYVDSVLTAMSTLQGAELNGQAISLRPLRESTHAVLMPASTMYPTTKERRMTVTSSDGLSDHSDDQAGAAAKARPAWDAVSSADSASSCIWSPTAAAAAGVGDGTGLDSAIEKLAIDGGNQAGSRSCASYSSISSGGGGGICSPSHHSLSPPTQQQQLQHMQPYATSAFHGSLRKPSWRPSRGPIPAPLLNAGGYYPRQQQQHTYPKEEYGSGGGGVYGSHAHHHNSAGLAPPSLFSQIIPPSPGYGVCSPSPYTGPHGAASSSSFFGGGGTAVSSPRPLFPEMYKSTATLGRNTSSGSGFFSPTAAPEEVLWRAQPQPLSPLLSPPGTGEGTNWFNYADYSVPQAYRGSGASEQFAAAAAGAASAAGQAPPNSLGGMLPPNSPPIGQCTRFFDFSSGFATAPRLRGTGHHPPPAHFGPSPHHHYRATPPASARPHAASPWSAAGTAPGVGARCAPRAPRSAATLHNSAFAWPSEFPGRF